MLSLTSASEPCYILRGGGAFGLERFDPTRLLTQRATHESICAVPLTVQMPNYSWYVPVIQQPSGIFLGFIVQENRVLGEVYVELLV